MEAFLTECDYYTYRPVEPETLLFCIGRAAKIFALSFWRFGYQVARQIPFNVPNPA
jgi:hypothetical protein